MESIKSIELPTTKLDFVNSAVAVLDKIENPKNKIIERLKVQMQILSSAKPNAGYSRMHSRHNRS